MTRFLIRRTLFGVVVLWVITVVVFALFYIAPADVARLLAGRQASPETVEAIRRSLGLDDPIIVQYGHFVANVVQGDLGFSYYNNQPVTDLIGARLPATVSLALGAAVIWLLLGISIGALSARRPSTLLDRGATGFALFFYSMPTFLLGLVFLYFLFYRLSLAGLDLFPPGGYTPRSRRAGRPRSTKQVCALPRTGAPSHRAVPSRAGALERELSGVGGVVAGVQCGVVECRGGRSIQVHIGFGNRDGDIVGCWAGHNRDREPIVIDLPNAQTCLWVHLSIGHVLDGRDSLPGYDYHGNLLFVCLLASAY